jgi:hypothetical protein
MRRAWLLLFLVGCKPAAPTAPEAAYRAFIELAGEAGAGNAKAQKALLDAFDTPTRAALVAHEHAASVAAGHDVVPDDPIYQLFQGGAPPSAITDIKVVSEAGDVALLQVTTDGGGSGPVKLVREDGRWKLHLDIDPRDGG